MAGVQLLVDGKQTDVIVPKNRRALLEAIVSPPEAQQTAIFFWYINGNLQQHLVNQQFHLEFSKTGEVKLEVAAQNDVSYAVMSPEVRVLVVERLGDVRGLADHHSVLVRNARIYTVLVGRGSNITYTWDFGDHQSPFNTTVPTTKHTYLTAGTYTLTVTLTTPLGDLHVTTSKVFVLRSGECDTPKVLGLYPKKIYNRREVSSLLPLQPVFNVSAPREGSKNVGPFRLRHDSRKLSIKWIFVAQNDIPQSPF